MIEVIDKTAESDFLSGRKKDGRSWHATFDWIIEPSNFTKILEGNYANRESDSDGGYDYGSGECITDGLDIDWGEA